MDRQTTPPARRLNWPGFVLDLERRELLHADGRAAELRRQGLEVLLRLGADAGCTVSKDELMRCVWPGVIVTEDSLVQAVADVRRVIGDNDHRIVRTVPRRGYALMVVPEPAGDAQPTGPVSLPATRSPLVGRERDVARVLQRLGVPGGPRLLTLTGAGGSGKTRLAVEVAALAASRFPGGVAFAALESVREAEVVSATVARALGLKRAEGQPLLEALAEHLEARPPLLLVLDNLEQLAREACNWLGKLLDRCATLTLLATSRSVLHLYGEHELQVPPLELPALEPSVPAPAVLAQVPAVALFVQRAQAADASFELTGANATALAHLCHALDGLPLAIELAAARIKLLSPQAMLARIRSATELDTISVASSDRPERQRTLRATLEWSHALLDPDEQRLFRRLGVFAGGWTLESAEAVCNCRRDLGLELLGGMASLLDKSLVRRIDSGGEPRLAMLNTVRAFALERLEAGGELALTQRAHAAWCLVVAGESHSSALSEDEAQWLDACQAEQDNFHAAFDALLAGEQGEWAMRLGVALSRYWLARDRHAEGSMRLASALALPSATAATPLRANACGFAGALSYGQGHFDVSMVLQTESLNLWRHLGERRGEAAALNAVALLARVMDDLATAKAHFAQALAVCRELGNDEQLAWALANLAQSEAVLGESALARSRLEESLALFRKLGRTDGAAWSLNQLGDIARTLGDWSGARSHYEHAASIFRSLQDRWGIARTAADLGELAVDMGGEELKAARELFDEALHLFIDLGHRRGIASVFEGLVRLASVQRDGVRARTLAAAVRALHARLGVQMRAATQRRLRAALSTCSEALAPEAAADAAGTAMTLAEACAYARGNGPAS